MSEKFLEFKNDFVNYTDKYGLTTPTGGPTGNGILYTAEYLVALNDNYEFFLFLSLLMKYIN